MIFALSAVTALSSSWAARKLPALGALTEAFSEPDQTPLKPGEEATLVVPIEAHQYSITPRFNYRLSGIVVSLSDAMGWSNITHKAVGDFLNTHDFCVIWGSNASDLDLSQFTFTHGDWTCYVSTPSSEAWSKFKTNEFSNSHILPSTPELAKAFRGVRIGDRIEIEGQLADYSIDGRPPRMTSTIRTDTGNGACEIIYVKSFRFLTRNHEKLYQLSHAAMNLMVLMLVALGAALFIGPFINRAR